ncbi:hypothetical protein BGZ65_011903, partial [Modicella reniformis]
MSTSALLAQTAAAQAAAQAAAAAANAGGDANGGNEVGDMNMNGDEMSSKFIPAESSTPQFKVHQHTFQFMNTQPVYIQITEMN